MRAADMATILGKPDEGILPIMADELLRDRAVLVLAPHPDDESLGCGALLAHAFARSGADLRAHVICLTDGAASHPGSCAVPPARLAFIRRLELETAIIRLGGVASDVTWIGAPDAGLVVTPEIVDAVTDIARSRNAGLLLAPSPLDPHCDHVAGARIGREVAAAHGSLRLAYYPVWSRWHGGGHAAAPGGTLSVRVPAGPFVARKANAIAAHASQLGLIVSDAPDGFEMPPGFAEFFAGQDEIYFLDQPGARR